MGSAGVNLGSHAHGSGKSFKGGFDDVVRVDAIELANMKSHEAVVDNGHEEFAHQLGVIGANALGGDIEAVSQIGPTRKVEGYLDQGFVEGSDEMAKANNAFAVAEGLVQSHTKGDTNVFIGVMVIDFKIAFGLNIDVKQAVGGDLVEHMVEEGDAGVGIALTSAVNVEGNGDIGFFGGAGNGCSTGREFGILHDF